MAAKDKTDMTVGGVRAIELQYRVIREIVSGQPAFYQSRTQLNTPGLGTLMPENFREVAEITKQCIELFRLELTQLIEAQKKFEARDLVYGWVSVHMPVRFLLASDADRILTEFCEKLEVSTTHVCFALPEHLLTESAENAGDIIRTMRAKGFHFMLTNFAAEGCPLMRLADLPVDYVLMSPEITHYIGRNERADNAVHSVIDFVEDLGAKAIADGVMNVRQAEALHSAGCSYIAGELAGKYMAERYIRSRSED